MFSTDTHKKILIIITPPNTTTTTTTQKQQQQSTSIINKSPLETVPSIILTAKIIKQ